MSEEMQKNEHAERHCFKKLAILVVMSLIISILSLGTSIYTLVSGGAGEKKVVISTQYDKGKSYEKAQKTEKPMIVFFYTDWCGYCQRFAPTFHKVTKEKDIKKNFAIAYVNCEKSENHELMEKFDVHGFPTVFVIDKNGNKTHLDNSTFFGAEAVEIISKNAMKAIGEDKDDDKEDKKD